jgi:3-oxoacyl-[acyl-carrier-protein] synthase I
MEEKVGDTLMKPIRLCGDSVVSPLGFTSAANFGSLLAGESGLREIILPVAGVPTYASVFSAGQLALLEQEVRPFTGTRFEQLLVLPVKQALGQSGIDPASPRTLFVFATTKGNIERIDDPDAVAADLSLFASALRIAQYFGNPNRPRVISMACISGLAVQITALRALRSGAYDSVVVAGADTVNPFILEGFHSLKALSPEPCRPFDRDRQGISLGESGAAMVLTTLPASATDSEGIFLSGGAISNDANHISGPSRTGEEMATCINLTLHQAGLSHEEIGFVSAHGTATLFNDEMESKALKISGLSLNPVHSLKGWFGHTLGAAGLIETIMCIHSLRADMLIASRGYENCGTPEPLNMITRTSAQPLTHFLKTMAGFGGCNAAVCYTKY